MSEPKCNLIIDSCSDLSPAFVDRDGLDVVHLSYILDGESMADDMFETRSAHDFYDQMRSGAQFTTSQISAAEMKAAFERAIESGIPTVYLAFSSGLSGCVDVAELVLDQIKQEHPEAPLYIVDTLVGSTPEGVLVTEALRMRERGMTAEELVAWVKEARFFVQTLFMVDDLEALHRGGRIPASIAIAGTKLDVKPLLSFDIEGKLSLVGVSRGRKKGLRQMAEFYAKAHDDDSSGHFAAIGNADCPKDADKLKDLLVKQDESIMIQRTDIGPTIGSHVGPGMVSISFWGSDRRNNLSIADRIANYVKSS